MPAKMLFMQASPRRYAPEVMHEPPKRKHRHRGLFIHPIHCHCSAKAQEKEPPMLSIKGLKVKLEDEDKQILKGVDLEIEAGKVHAIMGPNGSGKSTLSYVLSGKDGYEVTGGEASLEGVDLLDMEPEERAAAGLFLAFQYPVEIPGVGNMTFLRTAVNAQRKARGEEEMSAAEFLKVVRARAKELKIDADMLKRPVNVGFSGGEKKRNEILQMAMLEPKMCILDETDSGLDVDAMKLVAEGVNALRTEGRGFLVITHYQRLLDHIKPDVVHIMADGRIIKTGGPELALEVENNGYADILAEVA
jgi:Fe-S cluster assembly ATP-binding protein